MTFALSKFRSFLPAATFAMAGVRYRVGEIQLEPGDGIYLYTDGIVEQPTHRPFDVASGKT